MQFCFVASNHRSSTIHLKYMIKSVNSGITNTSEKKSKSRKTSLWRRLLKSPEPRKVENVVPVASIELMTPSTASKSPLRTNKFMDKARSYFRKGSSKSPHILTPKFDRK